MSVLHVVHCIDTEGPMHEGISETFERLSRVFGIVTLPNEETLHEIQTQKSNLVPKNLAQVIANYFSPHNLNFLSNWADISDSLDDFDEWRDGIVDDFGAKWVLSFFCVDHVNFDSNPRHKIFGFGEIHKWYADRIKNSRFSYDELQFHYHPKSISGNPVGLSSCLDNSLPEIHEILTRRIFDFNFYPTCFRPGFHAESPDINHFLEQWIPFDFANQRHSCDTESMEPGATGFADWRHAPYIWNGFHPSSDWVAREGNLNRWVFRCLNVGSRHRNLEESHVAKAFEEAVERGSAVLAFTDHDYRPIKDDAVLVYKMITNLRLHYPTVKIKFSSAEEACRRSLGVFDFPAPKLRCTLDGSTLSINLIFGELFSVQPYLAILTLDGRYLHDNLNRVDEKTWLYSFSHDFITLQEVSTIAIAYTGKNGKSYIWKLKVD